MKIIFFSIGLMFSISIYAKDVFDFAYLDKNTKLASAVMVLAPGMNTDGKFFLKESPWM